MHKFLLIAHKNRGYHSVCGDREEFEEEYVCETFDTRTALSAAAVEFLGRPRDPHDETPVIDGVFLVDVTKGAQLLDEVRADAGLEAVAVVNEQHARAHAEYLERERIAAEKRRSEQDRLERAELARLLKKYPFQPLSR